MMADPSQSQLPQDNDYWEALEQKINADAVGPLAAYAAADQGWYGVLARRAPWLVAVSAAAMIFLWLVLPAREESQALRYISDSIAPSEAAGMLITGESPPSVDALMVQFPPAPGVERQQ